jgi:hypothetical protein
MINKMYAIPITVKIIEPYKIWVQFNDGVEGIIDLSNLSGKGIFKLWNSNDFFNGVFINSETKAISWNEDIELCPNSIYLKLKLN